MHTAAEWGKVGHRHPTPLSDVQAAHVRKLLAENAKLEHDLKAARIVTDELYVRQTQLEEPDKIAIASQQAEKAIGDMQRFLDDEADHEDLERWQKRVDELVRCLIAIEEVELSTKELTRTVRNQEKRVLGAEDMEIDFSRQIRQMLDEKDIVENKCRKAKHDADHAERTLKMQAAEIEKRRLMLERLQVCLPHPLRTHTRMLAPPQIVAHSTRPDLHGRSRSNRTAGDPRQPN